MSTDINQFLQSMVEAKAAVDQLPGLRRENEHLRRQVHIQGETISNRELHIHNLKKSEADLIQKLRSVEAERDEAGFRLGEESDKVQNMLVHLRQSVTDSLQLISAVAGGEALCVVTIGDTQELSQLREQGIRDGEAIINLRLSVDMLSGEKAQLEADLDEATRPVPMTVPADLPITSWDNNILTSGAETGRFENTGSVEEERPLTVTEAVADFLEGQRALDPYVATAHTDSSADVYGNPATTSVDVSSHGEGSVQPDPTQTGQTGPSHSSETSSGTGTSPEHTTETARQRDSDHVVKLGPHPDKPDTDADWPFGFSVSGR
jgi:hypothetical protein